MVAQEEFPNKSKVFEYQSWLEWHQKKCLFSNTISSKIFLTEYPKIKENQKKNEMKNKIKS